MLLIFPLLPLTAQEQADTAYVFRFVPREDMFYVPFGENGKELQRLGACVERYREDILAGRTPLHVDGYCSSAATGKENLAIARIRSNRVKSELIVRGGLTESCFVTHNHSGSGDYVTVRIVVPIIIKEKETPTTTLTDTISAAESGKRMEEIVSEPVVANDTVQPSRNLPATTEETLAAKPYTIALRANLLRWATLTPDLGFEWRINGSWGIMVNGSWTSWSWNEKDRRYALWEVSPEVRYYIGKEKRGYVGAMFKAGQFNYKFSATGRQGDLMGGGITGGYVLKLNRALALDFNIGLGYLNADHDKYEVIDGVRVRRGTESKNWWGPVNAGVTLMWNLF